MEKQCINITKRYASSYHSTKSCTLYKAIVLKMKLQIFINAMDMLSVLRICTNSWKTILNSWSTTKRGSHASVNVRNESKLRNHKFLNIK
jgi:hypothetical protein